MPHIVLFVCCQNPILGTTIAFIQEPDENRCALYIEPDQLRFLYPWNGDGSVDAQAFIFTRNASSGKIDMMHRAKVGARCCLQERRRMHSTVTPRRPPAPCAAF